MSRDRIAERPRLAWIIMGVGVALYLLISLRAIGRRGYPEIDPFWVALPMLWFAPVALAQIFVTDVRRHWLMLTAYALVTAVIHAGAVLMIVPHHPDASYIAMMTGTYTGPLHCAGVFIIAVVCQFVLRVVRQVSVSTDAQKSAFPVRTYVYGIAVLCVALAVPFLYRHIVFANARSRGEAQAIADWQAGEAVWYVNGSEPDSFPATFARGTFSPEYGLRMEPMFGGPVRETYYWAYRAVIEAQLAHAGVPDVVKALFTPAEIQTLIDELAFAKVESFPFSYGSLTFTSPRDYTNADAAFGTCDTDFFCTYVMTNRERLLLVATDNSVQTFRADGTRLQWFDNYEQQLEVTEERLLNKAK